MGTVGAHSTAERTLGGKVARRSSRITAPNPPTGGAVSSTTTTVAAGSMSDGHKFESSPGRSPDSDRNLARVRGSLDGQRALHARDLVAVDRAVDLVLAALELDRDAGVPAGDRLGLLPHS